MIVQATLVTEGTSDTVLLGLLGWLLSQLTLADVELRWADLRGIAHKRDGLAATLDHAVRLYPCHILFVHRDSDKHDPDACHDQIRSANRTGTGLVCVVPVKMQEAWLLHNEAALRRAAGRPSGTDRIDLPPASKWERLPDPKATLHNALRIASGATGRRAKNFRPERAAHRLADLITDWSPIRTLPAFVRLEADTKDALRMLGVDPAR